MPRRHRARPSDHKSALVLWLARGRCSLQAADISGRALLAAAHAELGDLLVVGRVDESRVRVAVHERVDLQLGLVERVRRRVLHIPVHDLANPRV